MSKQALESRLALAVAEGRDHIRGSLEAPVTLVEYGDFECPYCGQAHYVLEELLDRFPETVRLVFRHFPLSQIHPHAQLAAEAAEAAGTQARFWEMHDMLFEHQDALDEQSLAVYAEAIGLDLSRFLNELASSVHAPRVREDFMSGVRSGVNGTPSFFINEVRHDGPWDLDSLAIAIAAKVAAGS